MNNEQKELLKSILENKEFLEEILKAASEEKKEIPELRIGDTVEIVGITWRKFKEDEDGNSYMLADEAIKISSFGTSNDCRESPIRKELGELAKNIEKEIEDRLVPIEVNLLSHDGLDDYGKCQDLVSILTYDLYRNNRKNIKLIGEWWWLSTPNSTPSGCGFGYVRCVNDSGDVSCFRYGYDGAVRPFFIFKS